MKRAAMRNGRGWGQRFTGVVLACVLATGCSVIGPRTLRQARLQYNEIVKTTSEEELLLNIVRLRYVDTPSSIAVSNIAAQFELVNSLGITPFFAASGAEPNRSFTSLLPQASIAGADRPTFSLTPLDESEFAKKLFTPITLEGVIYLVKTTWPISTVFRRPDADGRTWTLLRNIRRPVLLIDPQALGSPEIEVFTRTFRLKRGLTKYEISEEALDPFPSTFPPEGVTNIDLETRSLLQGLFFISHGVEVPPDHAAKGIARVTIDGAGQAFDWRQVTAGLFQVRWAPGSERPPSAHVAIQYKGYWFYIDEADHETKSTFTLLMELARLNFSADATVKPVLTLPLR